MIEQLEQELRDFFAEDAEQAPAAVALADKARQRVHESRRTRLRWGAGTLVAASVAATSVMAVGTLSKPPVGERAATPTITSSPSNQPSSQPTGALPGGTSAASCKIYSPAAVASMPLAFDGTVTAIGESRIDPQYSWIRLVTTSFTVHQWYRGGAGDTVTVEIPVGDSIDPGPPPFDIGTRLLVSGR